MAIAKLDEKVFLSALAERFSDYVPQKTAKAILADIREELDNYQLLSVIPDTPASDDSSDLVKLWLNAKTVEGASPNTIEQYRYYMSRIRMDIGVPFCKITMDHVRKYISDELERGISKSTIQNYQRALLQFLRWVSAEGYISENPCRNMKTIKVPKAKKEPFTQEQVQLIKEEVKTDKERAIVFFMLSTACRVGEVIKINRSDIDWNKMKLNVTGKGSKTREVYFDEVTSMMLKRYLDKRKDDHPALFRSRNGGYYTTGGIQAIMRKIGKRAGFQANPHRCRRTLAQTCLDRGMPLEEVQVILGHEKIDTTLRYAHANQRNTENSYRKYACM